jgi:cyclopropane fatty-acyl-phospholipid synthase-like methyltransferase
MSDPDARRHAPATQRNREGILAVLRRVLPRSGTVLEVASGSGEHATYFAAELPALTWQPSDPSEAARESITAWAHAAGLRNVLAPMDLDAAGAWGLRGFDAVLCVNMIHIAPWEACVGLMRGAAQVLPPGAPLVLYGPYRVRGEHTAPSNAAFDADLRARDARWGVRDLEAVVAEARANELAHVETVEMRANNLTLVFRRDGGLAVG